MRGGKVDEGEGWWMRGGRRVDEGGRMVDEGREDG